MNQFSNERTRSCQTHVFGVFLGKKGRILILFLHFGVNGRRDSKKTFQSNVHISPIFQITISPPLPILQTLPVFFLRINSLIKYFSWISVWGNQLIHNEWSTRKIACFQTDVWYYGTVTSQILLRVRVITQQHLHQKLQAKFTCP